MTGHLQAFPQLLVWLAVSEEGWLEDFAGIECACLLVVWKLGHSINELLQSEVPGGDAMLCDKIHVVLHRAFSPSGSP